MEQVQCSKILELGMWETLSPHAQGLGGGASLEISHFGLHH